MNPYDRKELYKQLQQEEESGAKQKESILFKLLPIIISTIAIAISIVAILR